MNKRSGNVNLRRAALKAMLAAFALGAAACDGENGGNRPPEVMDDTATVVMNGYVDIDVLANDSDPDGDIIHIDIDSVSQPAHGASQLNPDGTVRYTPEADFTGADEFTYAVSDGGMLLPVGFVRVTVVPRNPDNRPPVAADDTAVADENTPVTTGNVLANDTDPDGDPLSIQGFTQPARGSAVDSGGGTFTYTPGEFYSGTDSFTYTAADGQGGTDTATVSITVSPLGADLYVATDGDDANPGTIDLPFATLEKARDAIREMKSGSGLPDGGVAVWLRAGAYDRTAAFGLSAEDSGEATRPILYSAYPGEAVRLTGGIRLDPAQFSEVTAGSTPDVWSRIDPAAQGSLMQIDLGAYTTDYGELTDRGFGGWTGGPAALELFFNTEPMQLGRWPDTDVEYPFVDVITAISDTQFTYDGDRPTRWSAAEDLWLHGYWKYWWADRYMSVASLDTGSRTVTLTAVPGYGIDAGQPWYALNLLEEITMPGEWYLNRDTGILYFWPPGPLEGSEIYVSILGDRLINVDGAAWISFRDLTLEMTRVELVGVSGGSHIVLEGCVLRNSGLAGARIDGTDCAVSRCEIYDTGNDGVVLSGGDRASLTPGNNAVRNCHIHDFSRWVWTYVPAVLMSGAGNSVSHNLMHDSPHTAILYSGNDHLIEYNDIHDVCIWSSDAGAVYSGRDWGYRGNRIRYNFIHDVSTLFEGWGVHGIYMDDCLSGVEVFGNVLYRISGLGIEHGGGRDDFMENNVIVRCGKAMGADNRGTVWIKNDGSDWDLLQKIIDMGYQEDPWATAYPRLAAIPGTWADVGDPSALWLYPQGSIFSRNIGWMNDEWITESDWGGTAGVFATYEDISNNIENQDPLFVDEARLDLTLRPESPAFTIPGFEAIPFGEIGIEPE